jgi:GNAT superfamily N-acetyltransferase
MSVTVAKHTGGAIAEVIDDLARLRIAVFREFPYLYEGDLAYERTYLSHFANSRDAIVVVARDADAVVGCSTGSALQSQPPELREPLERLGFDLGRVFYCGESVLLPAWRGRGLGHTFFDEREAHAASGGYTYSAFAAVIRPPSDPPAGYRPLDAFWTKRGYAKVEGAIASLSWKDVGAGQETPHPMQFWMRPLS